MDERIEERRYQKLGQIKNCKRRRIKAKKRGEIQKGNDAWEEIIRDVYQRIRWIGIKGWEGI